VPQPPEESKIERSERRREKKRFFGIATRNWNCNQNNVKDVLLYD
jgi:hypothetical protein